MDSRQKDGLDFGSYYENLCALSSVYSLPCVKALLHRNILDINTDRIRTSDWMPILNTLKINRSLEHIAFRSTYDPILDNSGKNVSLNRKPPAIRSKEITYRICRSLHDSLIINSQLKHLCLDGVFIRSRDMQILAKGLFENLHLRTLSFEKTSIGDELFEILFPSIKNLMSLISLNLSSCQLTCKSAEILAELIKHQYTARHNEAWHDSLRYNKPDMDRMGGLRRITINNNPMIGDEGSKVLADCLRDDLWIKALDMHNCGLTKQGGEYMLDMLKFNSTLVVLDIRDNHLIDAETISNIMNQLIINIRGQETDFKWLKISGHVDRTPKKRRSGNLSFGSNKRNLLYRSLLNSSGRKRQKTKDGIDRSNVFGLPWRTALRAEIHRSGTPEKPPVYESLSDASSSMTPLKKKLQKLSESEGSKDLEISREPMDKSELILKLNEEIKLRMAAEDKVQLLSQENDKLSQEILELKQRTNILENDEVLESIEQSFQQFHHFLDTLKNMGLGKLIQMAGLDNTNTSKLNNTLEVSVTSNNSTQNFDYKSDMTSKNMEQTRSTNNHTVFNDINCSQLEVTKNQSRLNSLNETEYSGEDTPIAEQFYDISQSESSLKMDKNPSLWVKSMDSSGIYRNVSALETLNRSKKNHDKTWLYDSDSNKNLQTISYLYDSNRVNKHPIKETSNYLREFDNSDSITHNESSGYLRELNFNKIMGEKASLYLKDLNALSDSKITNQTRSFPLNNTKPSEITEDYVAKYLRQVEGLRSENIAPSGGDNSLSFDSGDIRRPRSKFDELYERIKNKSIINK